MIIAEFGCVGLSGHCGIWLLFPMAIKEKLWSVLSVPALRFKPGTSDSKAKTIPIHKRVWPKSTEESPLSLHFLTVLKRGDVWGDSIYHSAVACTQSCSIQTGLHLYHRKHHSLWWNMYLHKLQHGFFLNILITNWSAQSVPALRFEPGTSDSKAKRIPLHKWVWRKVRKNHLRHYNWTQMRAVTKSDRFKVEFYVPDCADFGM